MTNHPNRAQPMRRNSDSLAGYHQFVAPSESDDESTDAFGSFEVFWSDGIPATDTTEAYTHGWYWWSCFPGCLPDSDPIGPFSTSNAAYRDAQDS